MILHQEIITSRNNETVKWAASLLDKKGRDASLSFIAEGKKLSFEALSASLPVTDIFIAGSKREEYIGMLKNEGYFEKYLRCRVFILEDGVFSKISSEKSPQGIISVIKYLDFFRKMDIIYKEDFLFSEDERAIMLASIRDPGNLGSVIRSAVAFGVDRVILSSDSADIYNPKTVRGAMGSLFRVKIDIVSDMESYVESAILRGRKVYAAELTPSAKSLSELGLSGSDIVIIGNEGHGIPESLSEKCTGSVYIPISKKTESLNASVAAAIFMWETGK